MNATIGLVQEIIAVVSGEKAASRMEWRDSIRPLWIGRGG